MDILSREPLFAHIGETSTRLGEECYVVGGYVRDYFLGRKSTDIDIVVVGNGIRLANEFARSIGMANHVTVYKTFGTAALQINHQALEFVGARKESYATESRKPVIEQGTLADDQARRDFTINSMAVRLSTTELALIDPYNGLQDLHHQIIRTPLDPDKTFSDDPLRMMRAIRFACQLGFTIDSVTAQSMAKNRERIRIISAERIRDELQKIIVSDRPSQGFILMEEAGILPIIFPEFSRLKGVENIKGKSHKDNFYHTLEVLENVSKQTQDVWIRWAAILHDIAKPLTKRFDPAVGWSFHGHEDKGSRMVAGIFRRLSLPLGEPMKLVEKLVLLHLRPIVLAKESITDSAVRRLLFEAGDAIEALMILCNADVTTKNEFKARKYRDNFELVKKKLVEVEHHDQLKNWQPPVTGIDIMQIFGLSQGRQVGLLKNMIREAILDGVIPNKREEAIEFALLKGKELGLKPL